MTPCPKKYHKLYSQLKSEHDPHVIQWISQKEEIIVSAPKSFPLLRYDFPGVRRFKSGKLRILYALSSERPDLWEASPQNEEIIFLYTDLRKDETYTEALKHLRKHNIL